MSWKFIYEQAKPKCPLTSTNIDNTTDFTCPFNYILVNNKCINSLLPRVDPFNPRVDPFNPRVDPFNPRVDPFCPNRYKNLNGKCTQLDGLPTCSDGYIPFNNECKILKGTIPETEYTCPYNYTVLGGLCI